MSDRFDLEQMLLECWHVTADLELLEENVLEKDMTRDKISNVVSGIKHIYEMRFNKMWDIFEDVVANDYKELKDLRSCARDLENEVQELREQVKNGKKSK